MTKLASEIRDQLSRYLSGVLQPDDFRDWFALVLRDVHKSNDAEAEMLSHSIEWEFVDRECGKSSDALLKERLLSLTLPTAAELQTPSGTAVEVVLSDFAFPGPSALSAGPSTRPFVEIELSSTAA